MASRKLAAGAPLAPWLWPFFFVSARHARRVKRPESSDFGNTHASPVFPLVWRLSSCRSRGPAWRWTVARRLSRKEATLLFPTRLAAARRKQGRSFLSSGSPPRRIRQETRHALSPPTSPLLRKNSKQGSSTRKSFFFCFPVFRQDGLSPRAVAPFFRLQRVAARSASSAAMRSSSRSGQWQTRTLDAVPDRVHVPVGV